MYVCVRHICLIYRTNYGVYVCCGDHWFRWQLRIQPNKHPDKSGQITFVYFIFPLNLRRQLESLHTEILYMLDIPIRKFIVTRAVGERKQRLFDSYFEIDAADMNWFFCGVEFHRSKLIWFHQEIHTTSCVLIPWWSWSLPAQNDSQSTYLAMKLIEFPCLNLSDIFGVIITINPSEIVVSSNWRVHKSTEFAFRVPNNG